jgi:hypothetical protein
VEGHHSQLWVNLCEVKDTLELVFKTLFVCAQVHLSLLWVASEQDRDLREVMGTF